VRAGYQSVFLATLQRALREVELALRVAVLVAAARPHVTIAQTLGVSVREVRAAARRLERVARRVARRRRDVDAP